MSVDLQSVGLTAASFLTGIGLLALSLSRRAERAAVTRTIGAGTLAVGLALLALGLRNTIPDFASVVLGNSLLLVGFLLLEGGCRHYANAALRRDWLGLAVVLAQAVLLSADLARQIEVGQRVILVASCALLINARWAAFMFRGFRTARDAGVQQLMRAAPCALVALFASILWSALVHPGAMPNLRSGGLVLFAATIALCAVVSGVALLMLWLESHTELSAAIVRSDSILNVLPDVITIQDRNGRFLEVMRSERLSPSLRDPDVPRLGMSEFYPPEIVRARLGCILEALNTGALQVMEFPLVLDGKSLWLEARVVPYQADTVLTLVRDVTDRKASERVRAEAEATLRLVSENMGDLVILHNLDGTMRYVSPSAKHVLGYAPEEMLGLTPFAAIHPDDMTLANLARLDLLAGRPNVTVQYRIRKRGGEYIWVEARGQPVWGPDHKPVSYVTSTQDITTRRATEEQLRFAAMVARTASEAIAVTAADGQIRWVNDAFAAMTGHSAMNEGPTENALLFGEDVNPAEARVRNQVLAREGLWEGEVNAGGKTGQPFPVWYRISAVRDEQGVITHYVHVVSDRTREQQTREIIEHLSRHDALTKLPNRAYFMQALTDAIAVAPAEGVSIALLSINLDRFKRLNGLLGQAHGDRLLQRIAQRLLKLFDPAHTVVARVAGDEFVILLSAIAGSARAALAADAVMESLSKPFDLGFEDDVFVTSSIGLSVYPDDGATPDAILKASTTAMYHAKRGGGNAYRFFSAEMDSRDAGQLLTEARLRRAAESKDGLTMAYQPKLSLSERRITGMEALIRWHPPDGAMVSPAQFIPLAEDLGLIHVLGEWVLRTVCTEAVARHEAGFEPLRVAVNLSAKQLLDEGLPEKIQAILNETGLASEWLELEVTETCVMTARDQAARLLERLRSLGIRLCLDDFGTGHSSLSYLSSLPVDSIKIDRSFVTGLPARQTSVAICKAVIAMGRALDLKIVAEGVERNEELRFLDDHACDEIQGNLFAVPMSDEQLREFLVSESAHPNMYQA